MKNLVKLTNENVKQIDCIEDLDQPNLQMDQIKLMYQSFDNAKMTSTLINIDIEEMSYCLGQAIQKHIQFSMKYNQEEFQSPSSYLQNQNSRLQKSFQQNQDQKSYKSSKQSISNSQLQKSNKDLIVYNDDGYEYKEEVQESSQVMQQQLEEEEEQQHLYDEEGNEINQEEYEYYSKLIEQYKQIEESQESLGVISEKTIEMSMPQERINRRPK